MGAHLTHESPSNTEVLLQAGSCIQAAPGPTIGLQLVGCPTPAQWTLLCRLHPQLWCLWPKGFLGHAAGEIPGLSLGVAGLCWRVRGLHRCSLQFSIITSKLHGAHDESQGWHSWGLSPTTNRRRAWNLPHTRGGDHPPRWGHWTASSSRFYPRMMRNPQVCRTCWAKHHS